MTRPQSLVAVCVNPIGMKTMKKKTKENPMDALLKEYDIATHGGLGGDKLGTCALRAP